MNTMMQGAGMISGSAMWIFWLVVSVLMFFFIRACIRHSTMTPQKPAQRAPKPTRTRRHS